VISVSHSTKNLGLKNKDFQKWATTKNYKLRYSTGVLLGDHFNYGANIKQILIATIHKGIFFLFFFKKNFFTLFFSIFGAFLNKNTYLCTAIEKT
jgi:hypothetical protein